MERDDERHPPIAADPSMPPLLHHLSPSVVAGRRVWSLRVDIHALDNGGNLADACMLSCLAGLLAFR